MNERELKPKKYRRIQGSEWEEIKNDYKLLYTFKSEKGNIKGIYGNKKEKVSHWMTEDEKNEYLRKNKGK